MNLTDLTLAEAAEGITNGRFSALELTEATLARIEKINPQLNAYIHVESEIARTEAAEITLTGARGKFLVLYRVFRSPTRICIIARAL